MKDKNHNELWSEMIQSSEVGTGKLILSKHDFELFDDSKAVPARIIRVKRMGSIAKNEKWRIFDGDDLKFVLEGTKLSKKECIFLRTVEGINWLISEFKVGFKSVNELRVRLKIQLVKID